MTPMPDPELLTRKSMAELNMARIGMLMGALMFIFLLPLLPAFLTLYVGVKINNALRTSPESETDEKSV